MERCEERRRKMKGRKKKEIINRKGWVRMPRLLESGVTGSRLCAGKPVNVALRTGNNGFTDCPTARLPDCPAVHNQQTAFFLESRRGLEGEDNDLNSTGYWIILDLRNLRK